MAQEKSMSSRLLTMKFMQRSIASSPVTPKSASSPSEHHSKRQRLSTGSSRKSLSDYDVAQAALAEEELKRSQAIERQAAELGETKWVLSVQQPKAQGNNLQIVSASFGDIDASDSESEEDGKDTVRPSGRMTYGKKPTPQPPPKKRVSEEEEDSDEEEDDPSGLNDLIREGKAGAKQHPNAMPERKISSISHANSISKNTQSGASRLTCFRCGKVGHRKIDCPG